MTDVERRTQWSREYDPEHEERHPEHGEDVGGLRRHPEETHEHVDEADRTVVERPGPVPPEKERTERFVGRPAVREGVVGPAPLGLAFRITLTLAGAAALALAAFFDWLSPMDVEGRNLPFEAFYRTSEIEGSSSLLTSVGIATLGLAGLALLGFATFSGWLTRISGAFALIAFGAFLVTVFRASGLDLPGDLDIGAWLLGIGGVITVIAGFFGTRVRSRIVEH